MSEWLDQWLARKKAAGTVGIRGQRHAEFTYSRNHGPRWSFAMIRLRVESAEAFEFASEALWPIGRDESDRCTESIVDGVLDELLATHVEPYTIRLRVVIEAINWHEINSSASAFYHAARGALRSALGIDPGPSNVDWSSVHRPEHKS